MKKKIFNIVYWAIIIAISLWVAVSFVDVNHSNVTSAELAPWNLFEIIYQLSEKGGM